MEIKKIDQEFSVCQVEDYSFVKGINTLSQSGKKKEYSYSKKGDLNYEGQK